MAKLPSKSLEGRRIRLLSTTNVDTGLKPGAEGTVDIVGDDGTIHVRFENGNTLNLNWDAGDRWNVLSK